MDDTTHRKISQEPQGSIATASPEPASKKTQKRDFISRGESIHKWSTYLGVDWFFNAFSGVTFSYLAKYTETGKKLWTEPWKNTFKFLLGGVIKDSAVLAKSAERGTAYMSIIAGGMFTIPPLLVLENNKVRKKFIQFYDRLIYGKDEVKNDPRFQKTYDEIENAPKKDFTNGMLSRAVALVPLLTIATLEFPRKIADRYWFNGFEWLSKQVATKVFKLKPQELFKNIPSSELDMSLPEAKRLPAAKEARWNYIHHDGIAMDLGSGMPYAVMHAFFYNMFAAHKKKKVESQAEANEKISDKVLHAIEELPEKSGMIPVSHVARETQRRSAPAKDGSAAQSYGLV